MLRRVTALLAAVVLAAFTATIARADHYAHRNAAIICKVFGPYCQQAIRVARCESGLTTRAQNGQYLGLFQMGSYARGRFGHSWTPWGQARSARRYFIDSGKDWSPWSCRP